MRKKRLFRKMCTDPGSDLTTECAEETQNSLKRKKRGKRL